MKVAIYCRLSDEDRDKLSAHDDSASIQNQKSMLIKHAIERTGNSILSFVKANPDLPESWNW